MHVLQRPVEITTQSGHCHRNDFRRFELAESMFGRCTIAAAGGNAIIRVAGVRMGALAMKGSRTGG